MMWFNRANDAVWKRKELFPTLKMAETGKKFKIRIVA